MFDDIDVHSPLSKKEFKAQEKLFRSELLFLQKQLSKAQIATLILVSGTDGAGKGEVVDQLNKWFDSRGISTHAFWDETDEDRARPAAWRYWKRLPARGDIAIMFGGWYWDLLHNAQQTDSKELEPAIDSINQLEQMLSLDGLLIIKLWFHLPYAAFAQRMSHRRDVAKYVGFTQISGDLKKYHASFTANAQRVIKLTDSALSPWKLIVAEGVYSRDLVVAQALTRCMHSGLKNLPALNPAENSATSPRIATSTKLLSQLGLSQCLDKFEYQQQLHKYQQRLHELSWQAYAAKRSVVCLFEGRDAGGKGGAIRRVTSAMDARLYRVISSAAPSEEALAHHYLWRFWQDIPRDGYFTLYDRSWYGRVLVERVEKLATENEWQRAYQEINQFEQQLQTHGTIVLKFWLDISPQEQLRRLKEREVTAHKQHKLTEDDWNNRERWDDYALAVDEMLLKTDTTEAPWHLIAANDKYFARIEVLKRVCAALEKAMNSPKGCRKD